MKTVTIAGKIRARMWEGAAIVKPRGVAYAILVGILVFAVLHVLNALHIAEHSVWRAGIVGGSCSLAVSWIARIIARQPAR